MCIVMKKSKILKLKISELGRKLWFVIPFFVTLFFSCSNGCDDSYYFTFINESSEKIKFITWSARGKTEYSLKSGKSLNFDSFPPQTNFRILPTISKIEIIVLATEKTIKDSCDFSTGNVTCDADRGFFDRKSYFFRRNKFNDCGWYQYVFTDDDVKRAK